MKTGKRRRSRASRNDSVGVEVAGVTADLPARSSRLRAAGVAGGRDDGVRRQELAPRVSARKKTEREQGEMREEQGRSTRRPWRQGWPCRHSDGVILQKPPCGLFPL